MTTKQPVRVIAVTGGKGGIGKTNVSVNMSLALAKLGKRVVLMDADLGLANVDVQLGLEPSRNLSDVLNGECSLQEVMIDGPLGLKVVPAASGVKDMVSLGPQQHAALIQIFSEIDDQVDVLVVDTAAGISSDVTSFVHAAQEVLVVVCNEPASITDAYALIKVLNRDHGLFKFNVLVNMVDSAKTAHAVFNKLNGVADKFLDVALSYAGFVPQDEMLKKAVRKREPVFTAYPRSESAKSFKDLATKVDAWPLPKAARGHLEFFVESLLEAGSVNTI